MNPEALKEIATLMAQEQLHLELRLYVFLGLLLLVALVIGALVSGYFKRRGENLATKADFESLLVQMRQTTAVAEQVKAEISHKDWQARESKSIRREKLEQLVESIHELIEWQEEELDIKIFGLDSTPRRRPLARIERIVMLYFPDLKGAMSAFVRMHREIHKCAMEGRKELLLQNNNEDKLRVIGECGRKWNELYRQQLDALTEVEGAVEPLMRKIIGA